MASNNLFWITFIQLKILRKLYEKIKFFLFMIEKHFANIIFLIITIQGENTKKCITVPDPFKVQTKSKKCLHFKGSKGVMRTLIGNVFL